jgi:hypothetical protein
MQIKMPTFYNILEYKNLKPKFKRGRCCQQEGEIETDELASGLGNMASEVFHNILRFFSFKIPPSCDQIYTPISH